MLCDRTFLRIYACLTIVCSIVGCSLPDNGNTNHYDYIKSFRIPIYENANNIEYSDDIRNQKLGKTIIYDLNIPIERTNEIINWYNSRMKDIGFNKFEGSELFGGTDDWAQWIDINKMYISGRNLYWRDSQNRYLFELILRYYNADQTFSNRNKLTIICLIRVFTQDELAKLKE